MPKTNSRCFCLLPALMLVVVSSGCAQYMAAMGFGKLEANVPVQNPRPNVSLTGNEMFALGAMDKIPAEKTLACGRTDLQFQALHETVRNGFRNSVGSQEASDKTPANLVLHFTDFELAIKTVTEGKAFRCDMVASYGVEWRDAKGKMLSSTRGESKTYEFSHEGFGNQLTALVAQVYERAFAVRPYVQVSAK